jgi:hypothetical protein
MRVPPLIFTELVVVAFVSVIVQEPVPVVRRVERDELERVRNFPLEEDVSFTTPLL